MLVILMIVGCCGSTKIVLLIRCLARSEYKESTCFSVYAVVVRWMLC